ncbi:MAG: nicotinate-nucleotide--dimethylbenzimidazole phosphoribosyltransferase [Anderseniella sp.]
MTENLQSATSLAQFKAGLTGLTRPSNQSIDAARARQSQLTKPPGSLGKLEELAIFMAGWQGREIPEIANAQALVFAGNHGVCAQGVNPFPQEVTAQMVANFNNGGAAINQLCKANGATLKVVALELENPTADISQGPAMSETETLDALLRGAAEVDREADILLLGEMGIGNSTIAAAMACATFGGDGRQWAGPGTGSDRDGVNLKADIIDQAVKVNAAALGDPFKILTALGGREQAAICGAVLQARQHGIAVMLDGFICTAAASVLHLIDGALDHCIIAHASTEPGHAPLMTALGKDPVLNLSMRLGEGSGAAVALGVLRSALACHAGMATFAEAGVSGA